MQRRHATENNKMNVTDVCFFQSKVSNDAPMFSVLPPCKTIVCNYQHNFTSEWHFFLNVLMQLTNSMQLSSIQGSDITSITCVNRGGASFSKCPSQRGMTVVR